MQIILTVCSALFAAVAAWIAFVTSSLLDDVKESVNLVERHVAKLAAERARVTVLEREVDALRRWIKRVEGKLYANEREAPKPQACDHHDRDGNGKCLWCGDVSAKAPFCENYEVAQKEGPQSKAAQCVCNYCLGRRAAKAAFRDAAVPKTAQAQGELAKLNGGKP